MAIHITAKSLNASDFAPFGRVFDFADPTSSGSSKSIVINNGFAEKFPDVLLLDTSEANGRTSAHIYKAKARPFPLAIDMLEHHPFFSQTFIPLQRQVFIVVVAPPVDTPDPNRIQAFITNGNQGVHFARGVWHFPLIALDDGDSFLVLERLDLGKGDVEQCVIKSMDEPIFLAHESC